MRYCEPHIYCRSAGSAGRKQRLGHDTGHPPPPRYTLLSVSVAVNVGSGRDRSGDARWLRKDGCPQHSNFGPRAWPWLAGAHDWRGQLRRRGECRRPSFYIDPWNRTARSARRCAAVHVRAGTTNSERGTRNKILTASRSDFGVLGVPTSAFRVLRICE